MKAALPIDRGWAHTKVDRIMGNTITKAVNHPEARAFKDIVPSGSAVRASYRIGKHQIGEGGFSSVLKARQLSTDTEVAVSLLL